MSTMREDEKAFLEENLLKVYKRGRAYEMHSMLFRDKDALPALKKVGYIPKEEPSLLDCYIEGLRCEIAKESAKAFLRKYPFALIVLFECGLDLPFAMFDNGRCRCLCLDSPDPLSIRRALIPERVREERIACDTSCDAWMDLVDAQGKSPVFVIANDRFLCRTESEVKKTVDLLARRFHEGGIFFEYRRNPVLMSKHMPLLNEGKKDVVYRINDPKRELPYYSGYIRSCERITSLPEGAERLLPVKEAGIFRTMLEKEMPGFVNLLFE